MLDLLHGSYQAMNQGRMLLSATSDLQSAVHALVMLADGELLWAEAAAAGDLKRVKAMRRNLLQLRQDRHCLPDPVRAVAMSARYSHSRWRTWRSCGDGTNASPGLRAVDLRYLFSASRHDIGVW